MDPNGRGAVALNLNDDLDGAGDDTLITIGRRPDGQWETPVLRDRKAGEYVFSVNAARVAVGWTSHSARGAVVATG
jgi:hypothetical protein